MAYRSVETCLCPLEHHEELRTTVGIHRSQSLLRGEFSAAFHDAPVREAGALFFDGIHSKVRLLHVALQK